MFRRIAAGGMDFDGVPLLPERCPTNRQDTPAAQCRNLTAMVKLGGDNFDWFASSEKHPQTIIFLRRPKGPCQCCYFPFAFTSPEPLFREARRAFGRPKDCDGVAVQSRKGPCPMLPSPAPAHRPPVSIARRIVLQKFQNAVRQIFRKKDDRRPMHP